MNSQAALSEGPISAPTGRRSDAPLIGNVGQEFVQSALSNDPIAGINEIQARASLADPRCRPLLGLLHQLGVNRTDSHRYIVQQSIEVLLSRIPSLPGERLLSLLEETFPYITIPDLRAIPLSVLDRLRPVPSTFLKQLAADREIFWELPIGVQRQAWELDKKLLRTHALSLLSAYTYETATWMQALNMDEVTEPVPDGTLKKGVGAGTYNNGDDNDNQEMMEGYAAFIKPAAGGSFKAGIHHKLPQLARRNLRNGSAALRQLVAMVGSSPSVYRGIVDLCTIRFREQDSEKQTQSVGMKDAALCALRSQLLMAMHDAGETNITSGDSCHKLAWTLDACIKDKMFNSRRLLELRNFFSSFIKAADDRRLLGKKRRTSISGKRGGQRSGGRGGDDDAESAGVPGAAAAFADDPLRELGAAGMVLRDPAVFHLMLHQIVRCLEKCVEVQAVPKEDKDLVFLTQLLTLAVGVRSILRDGTYDFPEPDPEVLNTLYPLVADLILDAELMEVDDEDDGQSGGKEEIEEEVEPPPEDMVFLMVKDEIGRRVVQTYALKRLAAGDLKTASRLLQAIERCIGYLAIPEFAPFAFTLARRMASLLASGKITTSSSIWRVAVDNILIRLVDAETEAHEEVLRLLLAATKQLDAAKLGRYLASTLANSRPSRKEHKNRAAHAAGLPPIGYFGPDSTWGDAGGGANSLYSPSSGDLIGDWQYPGGAHDTRGPDGVRGTYALFVTKRTLLNEENAPELFEYLERTAPGERHH